MQTFLLDLRLKNYAAHYTQNLLFSSLLDIDVTFQTIKWGFIQGFQHLNQRFP